MEFLNLYLAKVCRFEHWRIVSVIARCVSHTIQLVAFDVTKIHKKNIKAIRKFVKNVRKSTHNDLFKHTGVKKTPKDVCTRWNSTFLMMKSIHSEMNFYKNRIVKTLQLRENHWNFITEYEHWLLCEIHLESLGTQYYELEK